MAPVAAQTADLTPTGRLRVAVTNNRALNILWVRPGVVAQVPAGIAVASVTHANASQFTVAVKASGNSLHARQASASASILARSAQPSSMNRPAASGRASILRKASPIRATLSAVRYRSDTMAVVSNAAPVALSFLHARRHNTTARASAALRERLG